MEFQHKNSSIFMFSVLDFSPHTHTQKLLNWLEFHVFRGILMSHHAKPLPAVVDDLKSELLSRQHLSTNKFSFKSSQTFIFFSSSFLTEDDQHKRTRSLFHKYLQKLGDQWICWVYVGRNYLCWGVIQLFMVLEILIDEWTWLKIWYKSF